LNRDKLLKRSRIYQCPLGTDGSVSAQPER